MDAARIGRRIQMERKKIGMTQYELSKQLGMTAKYISNIECGAKHPQLGTFIAIANALQVDANTLLRDELEVSDEILSSELWKKLSDLHPEKRSTILRVLDLLASEL